MKYFVRYSLNLLNSVKLCMATGYLSPVFLHWWGVPMTRINNLVEGNINVGWRNKEWMKS